MDVFKQWLNQKVANILKDFKEEQEPAEDPSPTRAVCRVLFVVILIVGFSWMLTYSFHDAPDVRVVQINNLHGKNEAFPGCFLNNETRTNTNCTKWADIPPGNSVVCPCYDTSVPWREFVSFYTLVENSSDWALNFEPAVQNTSAAIIIVPTATDDAKLEGHIVKNATPLTVQRFCKILFLWPVVDIDSSTTLAVQYDSYKDHCLYMGSALFPGWDNFRDTSISTQFLQSPVLLSREALKVLVAQISRDSILTRRLEMEMALVNYSGLELMKFYNSMTELLSKQLDTEEMELAQSYRYSAQVLASTLAFKAYYDENATVCYLGENGSAPIFLYPEIDWKKYYNACNPKYCEVTKPMKTVRKWYWALGIVGGVANLTLGLVTMLLWPCTARLLQCACAASTFQKPRAEDEMDPERPQGPFLPDACRSVPLEALI